MNYRIFETGQLSADLASFSKKNRDFLEKKLYAQVYRQMSDNPYYGPNIKKLKNYSPETWRFRIGRFRLFYEVDEKEKIIYVIACEDKKDAY